MEYEEMKMDLPETEAPDPEEDIDPAQWYAKYPKPDIWDRFKAHFVDTLLFYVPATAIYYLFVPGTEFNAGVVFLRFFFAIYINAAQILSWIFLRATNGSTPGKRLFKQRVVRLDGEPLTLKDVIIRDVLIKGVCNVCSFGLMNIASIIVGYVRPNNRALHDIAAYTVTISVKKLKDEEEPRVEFN